MKSIVMATVLLMGQFAFAYESTETYKMDSTCVAKLEKFAKVFAEANKMATSPKDKSIVRKVKINPEAGKIGESGYANVTGSFEYVLKTSDEELSATIGVELMIASEPHCAVMQIKMEGVE